VKLLALILLLAQTPKHTAVPDRLIGLLELPEIFSTEPCEPFATQPLTLHSEPLEFAQQVGVIEVLNPWKEGDGCQDLNVRFWRNARAEKFPTEEADYEQPAAVVLERHESWFRVKLEYGSAWLFRQTADLFKPYPDLLEETLTYIPQNWDNRLFESPNRASGVREIPAGWRPFTAANVPIAILGTETIDGELWFHIRFEAEAGCGSIPTNLPSIEGWVPGYRDSAEPGVWFHSRGC